MKLHIPVAVLLTALVACGGDAPPPDDSTLDTLRAAPPEPASITGFLTLEGEPVIARCGSGEELPVDGPALPDLLDLHTGLAPGVEPLEGVFVEVLGTVVEGPRGPEVDALEVRRAAWEGGGCGDTPADLAFQASGTEPFWSLTVLGETLVWRTPEGETTLDHGGPYRMERGGWQVDGEGEGGTALTARFYPEPCQNAMSGAWFHMTAEVELDGEEYRGCAYSGGDVGA